MARVPGAGPPCGPGGAGVVDQNVELIRPLADRLRNAPYLGQRRENGGEEVRGAARLFNVGDDAPVAVMVTAVRQDAVGR